MAKNKMTNRLLAVLASVAMLVGLFPVSWISAEPADHYGSLTLLNSDGTTAGDAVTGNEAEVVFTDNVLEWFSTENGLRPVDGWWVGARVTAPEGVDTDKATYVRVKDGTPTGNVESFSDKKDTDTSLDYWCLINEEKLNDALLSGDKYITYSWNYDWDGNGEYEQLFTLKVEIDGLKLSKDGEIVYPADSGKVTALTEELTVSGKGTENVVSATFEKAVTLEWFSTENGLRPVDGWWAGIRVTAPESADPTKIAYQRKTADGWKDQDWSADAEGKGTYVDFWCLLNEKKMIDDSANYVWRFDWDGDGVYEQLVNLDVDPAYITLMKGDEKCYPQMGTAAMLNTNGNVVGETFTGENTIVSFEDLSLEWVSADGSIGRNEDGWWAGMRIYAPTYMTEEDDLAKVVFKRKNGEAVTFEESKDDWHKDAKGYYIDQWCLLNETFLNSALINGKKVNYSWLFNWDGNEEFEQTVTLSVDPATVTLLKEGEEQKYPQMGAAINLDTEGKTYGDLQNGKDAVVLFTGSFKWVEADESIGRTQDGWWAGMRVYAPAYMQDAADLAKVTFTRKEVTTTYEQSKDDWHYDEDAKRWYIDQWCLITPEFLNNALANQKNVNYSWTFNWGVYDQKVTLSVDPANTVLLRDDKQVYPVGSVSELTDVEVADQGYVANENDESGWYTDATAKNLVLDWVEADESIGRNQRGWWAGIRVTAPKGSDKDTIQYQRKIGDEWADRSWAEGVEDGDHIDFWCLLTHEKLSNKDTTYIWRFDWNGDGKYDQYVTYVIDPATCTLNKKACDDFAFTSPAEKVWTGDDAAAFVADSRISTGTVTYSIVDQPKDGLATIDAATGKITFNQDVAAELKADDKNSIGTITVKATITADEYYEAAEVTHTFEAYKVPFKGFAIKAPEAVTYDKDNNTFENKAYVGDEGTDKTLGTVVYRIKSENALTGDAALTDGQHVVTIDENEGNLTILRSGVVTVEAVRVEDGKYLEVIAEYTLTINKGEQTLTFAQGNEIDKYYGITEFENVAGDNGDENANADGKITYTLADNNLAASIDAVNGKISIGDSDAEVGQLKVTATYAEDVCYNACSVSYTLNIAYLPVDGLEVSLNEANENGWYKGDVVITAPEGYSISYSNDLHGNTWAESVTYTAAEHEGNTNPIVFLRRDADNAISGTYVVKYEDGTVNVDVTKPFAPTITYEGFAESDWKDGYCYKKDAVTVTFAATDNLSQIDYFEYNLGDGDKTVKAENNQASIVIDSLFDGSISVKAVDKAGNESDLTADERVLVVDNIAPEVEITYTNANLKDVIDSATKVSEDADDNTRFVYNGDVIATIVVEEDYFYSEDVEVLLDGAVVDVTWAGNSATVTITGHGSHTLQVNYTDRSSNKMECACTEENKTQTGFYVSNERFVDTEAPVLNVSFDNNIVKDSKDGYDYFDAHRTATITVEDPNFYPKKDKVTLTIVTKNVDGEYTYANLELAQNWVQDEENGNLWIAEIPFNVDAVYDFQISVEDVAGNATTSDEYHFVVDTSAPAQPTIKLKQSFLEKVGEWLGFFKDTVTVEVSSEDITSGIKEITYSYTGTVSTFDTTVVAKTETLAAEDGKISFDLPRDFKGTITATPYNWSGIDGAEQSVIYDAEGRELREVIVDNASPSVKVEFTADNLKDQIDVDKSGKAPTRQTKENADADTRYVYNGKVTATVTVTEANFYEEDVEITVYRDGEEVQDVVISEWTQKENTCIYTKTIEMSVDGDYQIKIDYKDKSHNQMDVDASGEYADKVLKTEEYVSNIHTIDTTAPQYSVTYNDVPMVQTLGDREYYGADRTATITVTDRNFRPNEVDFTVEAVDINGNPVGFIYSDLKTWKDGNKQIWKQSETNVNSWIATVPFNVDANYTVKFDYVDIAGNWTVNEDDTRPEEGVLYTKEFTVDKVVPTDLTVDYSETFIQKVTNWLFYNDKATVTLSATDAVAGIDYFNISVSTEGLAEATNLDLPVDLVVNADGTVKSGKTGFINNIQSKTEGGKVTLTFDVPAQFRGKVHIDSVTDYSANKSGESNDEEIIVVDTISPDVKVEFTGSLKDQIDVDKSDKAPTRQTKATADADTRYVYNGKVTAKITVKEANFYEDMVVTVYCDGKKVEDVEISEWSQVGKTGKYVKTVKMTKDGDYQIKITYKDKSDNVMDVDASGEYADKVQDKMKVYTSNIHTVDTTAPVYTITYNNNKLVQQVGNREYYGADRVATITVTDRNFRPNEVKFSVVAKDVNGAVVDSFTYSTLTNINPWEWTRKGDVWTARVPFKENANYTVKFDYTDIAGNKAVDTEGNRPEKDTLYISRFTVDKAAPIDLAIAYKQPTKLSLILNMITFNWYKSTATVTISATDEVAGVDYFDISINKSGLDEATTLELPKDLQVNKNGTVKSGDKGFIKKFTAKTENGNTSITMELPVQYSGKVLFTAHDYSGKSAKFSAKKSPVAIVDSIAPQVDVEYVAQSESTKVHYVKNAKDAEDFSSATQAYFNGNVTAKITVTEANFFEGVASDKGVIHNVGILLTKTDNNGNVTKIEYLPKGAAQMFADEADETKNISWKNDGQVHTFNISYEANMDYVLTIRYADMSTNSAVIKDEGGKVRNEYTSRIITVDKTDPTIKVVYGNKDVISTNNGRKYFNKAQTATITIKEHNFRANDVKLNLVAKDVADNTVEVENFAKYLKTGSNWKHYDENGNETKNGNVHVATITFSKDANYTLDIDYNDLSTRASADYTPDLFTVDKTKPATKGLKVTYDKGSVWEDILESITFGFYNAQMTVTISANDPTAGIHRFEYSYEPSEGVSDINKGAKGVIKADAIKQIEGTSTFTASFKIPKLMLGDDNQFNGTVSFAAYDRAENFNEKDDTKRIVLDNIKPEGTMTFDEPINKDTDKNIDYYTDKAVGTIVINEANFYVEKVTVTETVNGGASRPVRVEWTHNSTDVHTGVFTLTEEGDHVVTVDCEDYSGNKMKQEVSRQITIDRTHPTVTVSNIKNNSANKDEVYGFTITANDTNFDPSKFQPVLKALVPTEGGKYMLDTISLGTLRTVEAGKTYSYTVENLDVDAVYTLTCTTQDMSQNPYNLFRLDDGSEYESVTFSINRDGSAFGVDADTAKLLEQYYIHNVENNVVIEEVNVDPVETYVVRLNGTELVEGQDYNTLVSQRPDEWYKRTYVIKKTLFENEGEYNIVVESVDKTETTAYSDIKNLKVAFVVDRTAPVLTINGLEDKGTYMTDVQNFTIVPTDDGGRLHSLKVILTKNNGEESVLFDMSEDVKEGEESLSQRLAEKNGEITIPIPEVIEGKIQIICNDYAATQSADSNITVYDATFKSITVSTSGLVAWAYNTPIFIGSIAGVVLLAGGVVLLIVLKKRKKNAADK